jgi:hypothetical protein
MYALANVALWCCTYYLLDMLLVVELEMITDPNQNENAKLVSKFDKVVRQHTLMVCNNHGLFPTFSSVLVYNWLKTSSMCRLTSFFVKRKMQLMCVQTTCVISYHPKSNQSTWFLYSELNGTSYSYYNNAIKYLKKVHLLNLMGINIKYNCNLASKSNCARTLFLGEFPT